MTVPANFDQRQKAATMEAARLAGLKVVKLISEPAAAAVAYEMKNNSRKTILVYDFGGGRLFIFHFHGCYSTPFVQELSMSQLLEAPAQEISRYFQVLDISILVLTFQTSQKFISFLGGQDIDKLLTKYAISEYNQKSSKKFPEHNWRAMKRLRDACIKAKITLSTNNKSTQIIVIYCLFLTQGIQFYSVRDK